MELVTENLAQARPGTDHVRDLWIIVGPAVDVLLSVDKLLHDSVPVSEEVFLANSKANERDALDCLSSKKAKIWITLEEKIQSAFH